MATELRDTCEITFSSENAWMCFLAEYMFQGPLVPQVLKAAGPIILHMDQNDYRNTWKDYPDEYASRIRDVMISFASSDSNVSAIAPKCGNHCVSKEINGKGLL